MLTPEVIGTLLKGESKYVELKCNNPQGYLGSFKTQASRKLGEYVLNKGPILIDRISGDYIYLFNDAVGIHRDKLIYFQVVNYHENITEGIAFDEIPSVIEHIKNSSFYCRLQEMESNSHYTKILILLSLGALWLYKIKANHYILTLIVIMFLMGSCFFFMVIYYLYSYRNVTVNESTFQLLEQDRPTMRYLFSGDLKNCRKQDLTNSLLYDSYDQLKKKNNGQ